MSFLSLMSCLNSTAVLIIAEILQNLVDIIMRNDLITVKNDEVIIIRSSFEIVVEVAGLETSLVLSSDDFDTILDSKAIDSRKIVLVVAVIKNDSIDILLILIHAFFQCFRIEIISCAIKKDELRIVVFIDFGVFDNIISLHHLLSIDCKGTGEDKILDATKPQKAKYESIKN